MPIYQNTTIAFLIIVNGIRIYFNQFLLYSLFHSHLQPLNIAIEFAPTKRFFSVVGIKVL